MFSFSLLLGVSFFVPRSFYWLLIGVGPLWILATAEM